MNQITFNSVPHFIQYFQKNVELVLKPDQELTISNVEVLHDDTCIYEKNEVFPEDILTKITFILNKMISPIAKTFRISFLENSDVSYSYKPTTFSLRSSKTVTLKTYQGTINTHLTDLFRLMITSSILKITFAPDQKVVILGLTPKEIANEKKFDGDFCNLLSKFISARTNLGFDCKTTVQSLNINSTISSLGENPERGYVLQSKELSFELRDVCEFYGSKSFLNRLELTKEITVNSKILIKNQTISYLINVYKSDKLINSSVSFQSFAMSHMLLPLGKTVIFEQEKKGICSIDAEGDCLQISTDLPFTIKMADGDLITNLYDLGEKLIESHRDRITVKPSQTLKIHGVTKEEIQHWISSKNPTIFIQGLKEFLGNRNPLGFIWSINFTDGLACIHSCLEGSDIGWLRVSSEKSFSLELKRASGSQLILNILKSSHPIVIEKLIDRDVECFIFIIFKVICYFVCDDYRHYRNDDIPQYFQKKTLVEILRLVHEDKLFEEALSSVISGNGYAEFCTIVKGTPEEFDNLDETKLPKPLQKIINDIKKVAYGELQGESPLVLHCLKIVTEKLASETK